MRRHCGTQRFVFITLFPVIPQTARSRDAATVCVVHGLNTIFRQPVPAVSRGLRSQAGFAHPLLRPNPPYPKEHGQARMHSLSPWHTWSVEFQFHDLESSLNLNSRRPAERNFPGPPIDNTAASKLK